MWTFFLLSKTTPLCKNWNNNKKIVAVAFFTGKCHYHQKKFCLGRNIQPPLVCSYGRMQAEHTSFLLGVYSTVMPCNSSPEMRAAFTSVWVPARPCWECGNISGYGNSVWEMVCQALQGPSRHCACRTNERPAGSWGKYWILRSAWQQLFCSISSGTSLTHFREDIGRDGAKKGWHISEVLRAVGKALRDACGWAKNRCTNPLFIPDAGLLAGAEAFADNSARVASSDLRWKQDCLERLFGWSSASEHQCLVPFQPPQEASDICTGVGRQHGAHWRRANECRQGSLSVLLWTNTAVQLDEISRSPQALVRWEHVLGECQGPHLHWLYRNQRDQTRWECVALSSPWKHSQGYIRQSPKQCINTRDENPLRSGGLLPSPSSQLIAALHLWSGDERKALIYLVTLGPSFKWTENSLKPHQFFFLEV